MIKSILLVEDEENDVFFFKHAMKREGMANPLRVASDGQEAIEYLQGAGKFGNREEYPLPYLVVLDLKLPYVMGLDVLKWIRQQSRLSPLVIILSSSQQIDDISTAYQLGANAYLVKTPDLAKLQEMVRAIRDFWLTNTLLADNPELERSAAYAPGSRSQEIIPMSYRQQTTPSHESHHVAAR
jgi:DNA-binding response OmpR family regulator